MRGQSPPLGQTTFLRQSTLPVLKVRWPVVNMLLARSARHCADADAFLINTGRNKYRTKRQARSIH